MTKEEKRETLLKELPQFIGSENWYRHGLNRNILYTDGVKFLAETAGAYWLIDEIAFTNAHEWKVKNEPFQVWTLTTIGNKAMLSCDDGNNNVVYRKRIEFTDFPLEEIKLYYSGDVILLTSEY